MYLLGKTAILLAAMAFLSGCRQPPPPAKPIDFQPIVNEVNSTDGGFKITFPSPPTQKEIKKVGGKPAENYVWKTTDQALVIGFSYPTLPAVNGPITPAHIAGGLDGAASAYVRETKGEFTEKKEVLRDGVQGLEFASTTTGATPKDSGVTRGRVYWHDGRLIRIVAIGQPHFVNSKQVDDFFASFTLLKSK